jgi:hypothetical protein
VHERPNAPECKLNINPAQQAIVSPPPRLVILGKRRCGGVGEGRFAHQEPLNGLD